MDTPSHNDSNIHNDHERRIDPGQARRRLRIDISSKHADGQNPEINDIVTEENGYSQDNN
jgi:hypothetical protein